MTTQNCFSPAIADQLVLVTGASRGLGAEIAHAFLQQGASVIVNYLKNAEGAQHVVNNAPERALAVQADVCNPADLEALVAKAQAHFGRPVSTVVNNALPAFSFNGDARPHADSLSWDQMHQQLEGIVRGALNTTQAVLPGMRAQGFGRIINIGTNLVQNPVVPYHDYTASKAALLARAIEDGILSLSDL